VLKQFAGIYEKLKRADQNIRNLDRELRLFIKRGRYSVVPENKREITLKAIHYHKKRRIPPRFPVLPTCDKEPVDKNGVSCFDGKVKGIAKAKARKLILKFQPYKTPDPTDDLLSILHHFDIVDKHRELVVCLSSGARKLPAKDEPLIESYKRAHPELTPAQIAFKFKGYGKLVPQVSFRDFGRRPIQPVIPGLIELRDNVARVIAEFAKLL